MAVEIPKNVSAHIDQFTGREWLLPHLLAWLGRPSERMFLMTGTPGTGKSSMMAWLAGFGPLPVKEESARNLVMIRSQVKAAHFCVASSDSTAPKTFAQNVANQLIDPAVPGFGDALADSLSDRISISSVQSIGTVAPGAKLTVTGNIINRIDLGDLGEELSFDRILLAPLKLLYKKGYDEPLLILVDALDEAMTYTGKISIVGLLAKITDLSERVRIIATTRPVPKVLAEFHRVKPFDLIDNAPSAEDDVKDYALTRLEAVEEPWRTEIAAKISKAAGGTFLYARLVLDFLEKRGAGAFDPARIKLPDGLSGLYVDFLNRDLGLPRSSWFRTYRPLLGVISVAQGEGLRRPGIERFTGFEVEEALEESRPYLNGDLPNGPFRLFHQSFAEFLLKDANIYYHIDAGAMHLRIADSYWAPGSPASSWQAWDDYGVRYMATHLAAAAQSGPDPERHRLASRAIELVKDCEFFQRHQARVQDLGAYEADMMLALEAATHDEDPRSLVLVVTGAEAILDFRREQTPASIFELAGKGDLPAAIRRLDLFLREIDEDSREDWRRAIHLAIAWLGSENNPAEALSLFNRTVLPPVAPDPLPILRDRVGTSLHLCPPPPMSLGPPQPREAMEEIVARMAGMDANLGLIDSYMGTQEMLGSVDYLAVSDGPLLVAHAHAKPADGDQLLDEYIGLHSLYSYPLYRNRSLWILMKAVLQHPDPGWARRRVVELASAALAGSRQDFEEALRVAILALLARDDRTTGATEQFQKAQQDIWDAMQTASSTTGGLNRFAVGQRLQPAIAPRPRLVA